MRGVWRCLAAAFWWGAAACGQGDVVEVLSDPGFARGFAVAGQTGGEAGAVRVVDYGGTAKGAPLWRVAQWGVLGTEGRPGYDRRDHDLRLAEEACADGVYVYATRAGSKTVRVDPARGTVGLYADTLKEYGGLNRRPGEDWPHVLIEQPIRERFFLKRLKAFRLEMEFEIVGHVKGEGNTELNTAQFQVVFTLQNLRDGSPRYGDYVWMNLTMYDDRYRNVEWQAMCDGGKADATGKAIVVPASGAFMPCAFAAGKRIKVDADILPLMLEAVARAKALGGLAGTELEEIAPGSLNIGWEIPGIYRTGAEIFRLSVTAERNE